jgi:hypothetical protein
MKRHLRSAEGQESIELGLFGRKQVTMKDICVGTARKIKAGPAKGIMLTHVRSVPGDPMYLPAGHTVHEVTSEGGEQTAEGMSNLCDEG